MNRNLFKIFSIIFTSSFIILLVLLAGSCSSVSKERSETIFCGGGLWSAPNNWNPITPWASATGTIGLVYETLFSWDPATNIMTPWLAEKGDWISPNTYQLLIRKDLKWTDDNTLDADDVKFTFELSRENIEIYYSNIWKSIARIDKVDDYTLNFTFKAPRYHEWNFNLYMIPIIPKHIWEGKEKSDLISGANNEPIGSGAYLYNSYDQDKMIYSKNDNWWGIKQLNLNPAPKKIVYLKIYSNNIAFGMIKKGDLDLSNFFLPGIPTVKDNLKIHTWYKEAPYMLSDNTAFLFINNKKKTLNNPVFRKALAYSINIDKIVTNIFEEMVLPANPLGFLPIENCMQYYNEEVVKKYGFNYDKEKAKKILDEAGYIDKDGDGFRDDINGESMKFYIIVPNGWTDWMESAKVISSDIREIGINAEAKFPEQGKYFEDMSTGEFDLAIRVESDYSKSIWTLYNWLFQKLEGDKAISGNFERYENARILSLLDQLNATPLEQVEKSKEIISEISEICLKDMPVIPLWFNGMWFQASSKVWTNWPSEENPYAYPTTWGKWQLGGLKVLTQIKSKNAK